MEGDNQRQKQPDSSKKEQKYNPNLRYLKNAPTEKSWLKGERFINECDLWKGRSLGFNVISFFANNLTSQPDRKECAKQLPVHRPDLTQPRNGITKVTWLGHATVLIQDGPVNIITDPVFVDRIVTYCRLVEKPVDLKGLPRIDIVLISHDHGDHFDEEAVRYLVDRYNATVIIGKNSKDLLPSKAASRILDLDWTQKASLTLQDRQYEIHFLPSCHWSGRGLTDHFKRLWGGFLVVTPEGRKIYYPGDTGYEIGLFKEIRWNYGPIDLCLLPIGAYLPREFLCYQHIDPAQAVKIHAILESKQSLGIHWGTFQLACEGFLQPRDDLYNSLHAANSIERPIGNFCCVEPGQSLILGIDVTTPTFVEEVKGLRTTWLGHCSVLLEYHNWAILVNPHFRNSTMLLGMQEVKREIPPISIKDIKTKLVAVLLTSSNNQFVQECDLNVYEGKAHWILQPNPSHIQMPNKQQFTGGVLCTQFSSLRGQSSYLLRFPKGKTVCIYGSFANNDFAKQIVAMEKDTRIDLAYIPIRPLGAQKEEITIGNMYDVVDIHIQLQAEKSVAINWAGFTYIMKVSTPLSKSQGPADQPKTQQTTKTYESEKEAGVKQGAAEYYPQTAEIPRTGIQQQVKNTALSSKGDQTKLLKAQRQHQDSLEGKKWENETSIQLKDQRPNDPPKACRATQTYESEKEAGVKQGAAESNPSQVAHPPQGGYWQQLVAKKNNAVTHSSDGNETKPLQTVQTESRPTKPKPVSGFNVSSQSSTFPAPLANSSTEALSSGPLKHKAKRIQEDILQPKRDLQQALQKMRSNKTKTFELMAVGATIWMPGEQQPHKPQ